MPVLNTDLNFRQTFKEAAWVSFPLYFVSNFADRRSALYFVIFH